MQYKKVYRVVGIEEHDFNEKEEKRQIISVTMVPTEGGDRSRYPHESVELTFPLGENPFKFGELYTVVIGKGVE